MRRPPASARKASENMEGYQLSHDEYNTCANACVKVAIFDRPSEQLSDDVQPSDEGFNGDWQDNLRNFRTLLLKVPSQTWEDLPDFMRYVYYKIVKGEEGEESYDEEIDRGSGFISFTVRFTISPIGDGDGVVEDTLIQAWTKQIRISKGELFCEVVRCGPYHLATQNEIMDSVHDEICPLQLFKEAIWLSAMTLGFRQTTSRGLIKQENGVEIEKCGNATKQGYNEESSDDEIDHGSGFIIDNKHVITNKHVVEDALHDETKKILISNAAIGVLLCEVVRYDVANDLALLYCWNLDLKQNGICPLQLSEEALWPSVPIFTFGYPITHTGETALFVKGYVSGSVERYGREPFMVLNCAVNHGNSGGPVICRIKDELKVVAVIAQRHKKEIVTIEERNAIEEMRNSLQTNFSSDLTHNDEWKGLTLKLFDALETHCQFNLCNAVPGRLVIGFMNGKDFKKE